MINKKMVKVGSNRSVIRELFEYGKTLSQKIGAENVFDFTLGNPKSPCPQEITDTIVELVKGDAIAVHSYTSAQGDLATRQAICDYNSSLYGFSLKPELVYMTCGAAASLAITLKSIISSKKDKILLLAPYFPEYKVFTENAGGTPVLVNANEQTFEINFEDFEEKLDDKVWGIIVNSPNNPSGAVYSKETIIKLSALLKRKEDEFGHAIYLIIDEPYREIIFDDIECPFIPNYYNNSIICYSYSKALSLPGERIGYVAVSPLATDAYELYNAIMGAGRSMGYVCAPSLFQKVIAKCVSLKSDSSLYKTNRDILVKNLTEFGFKLINPKGAFYIVMKAPDGNSVKFSNLAKKLGVLIVPTDSFGVKGYVRIATCVSLQTVNGSLPKFKKIAKKYNLI